MKTNKSQPKGKLVTKAAPLLLLVFLAGMGTLIAQTKPVPSALPPAQPTTATTVHRSTLQRLLSSREPIAVCRRARCYRAAFDNLFTLADIGVADTIELRGVDAYHTVYFAVPQTQVVKTATMKLRYHFSPGLIPALSHLKVSLNGTVFATLPVTQQPTPPGPSMAGQQSNGQAVSVLRNESSALLEATLTLPAEMLVHDNQLTFEFIGHYTMECEDPSHTTLWSQVDATSTLELAGSLLPLHNDLKLLPLPFYDSSVNLHPSVPIVFTSQPSAKALAGRRHRGFMDRHPDELAPSSLSGFGRDDPSR